MSEGLCHSAVSDEGGSDIDPKGLACPVNMPFNVEDIHPLPVSCCGPASVQAVQESTGRVPCRALTA